jgi:hypothetical protein
VWSSQALQGMLHVLTSLHSGVEERVIHTDGEHVVMYSTRMYVCAFILSKIST